MEVYIEDAILQNLFVDYMILSISEFAINKHSKWYKLFFVALFGAIFAVVLSLFQIKIEFLIPIKIFLAIIIALLMVKEENIKKYLLFIFVFLSITFIMGGGIVAFQNLFDKNLSGLETTFILFVLYLILKNIFKQFYVKKKIDSFYYDLVLSSDDKKCKITAYLDSGNLLIDEQTGLSILVIDFATFEKLYQNKISVIDFLQQKLDKKINGKYIEYKTVGGKAKMFVCKIDNVALSTGKNFNVLIGVGKGVCNEDYQGLLSPLAINL